MKLVLIQPPIEDFYETDIRLQPIGLCYLKAALRDHLPEVEVVVKDYHRGWGRKTAVLPKELAYLKDYYVGPDKSPFSTFSNYYHFGADYQKIVEDVLKEKPDMVGISSLFSPYYREVLECAKVIKRNISVPVLLGGSHVSAVPELMLKHPCVDFIIRGEGERPLVEFLKAWINQASFKKIPNLGYKENGICVLNSMEENFPIEALPHPDISDFSHLHYQFEKRPLTFVITSRSCPHRCSFCSVHTTFGLRFQRRKSEDVIQEIEKRYTEGIRVFDFEDDNLTFYIPEMKKLLRALIEKFPNKDVEFLAMNGISYLSLDDELLELMKEAGFTHLNLALVTSDTTVRETTKRPHTIEKYLTVVRKAFELHFKIVSYQILGLPGESLDSMIQTLVFSARQPVLLGSSMFYLTPQSPIARTFPQRNEEDIFKSRLTAMAIETDKFQREDIYTLFITTRIINFLKGLKLEKDNQTLESLLDKHFEDSRLSLGMHLLKCLLEHRVLYASTSSGLRPLLKFKPDLFFKVWNELDHIQTQQGQTLYTRLASGMPVKDLFLSGVR
jgi:radical SAM superfamily enzyme YgiQ (UPF0313 family)